MVQILRAPILLLFLLVVPSFAVPLPHAKEDINNIALREPFPRDLVSRRIHVHLPKVHLPHIDGHKVLEGLRKWAPKIGKTVFKIASKLILREEKAELQERSAFIDSTLFERDVDSVDGIYELVARSPRGRVKTLKKLYTAAKKMKKYAKKYAKAGVVAATMEMGEDLVERSELLDINMRDEDWEYDFVARELEGSDIDAREIDAYLDILVRGLEGLMFEERDGREVNI